MVHVVDFTLSLASTTHSPSLSKGLGSFLESPGKHFWPAKSFLMSLYVKSMSAYV